MTNQNDSTLSTLSGDAELAAAFETKESSQQVEGNQQQVGQEGVETNPDPSRSDSGTPPSRTEATPSREELLANLTWDEVKALEHLKPALKSEVDREAARELRGKSKEIEDRVRQETTVEFWKKHFEEMDPDVLSETITKDPEARRLYAMVSVPPPPPPSTPSPEASSVITYYQNVIQTTNARVQALPDKYKVKLDPKTYAEQYPDMDPETLIAKWQGEIVDAEVAVKLAKESDKTAAQTAESKRIDDAAAADESRPGALIDQGRSSNGILPPYGTRSDLLLEDAFARTAVTRR